MRGLITSPATLILVCSLFNACNSGKNGYSSIPTDSATIAKGRLAFSQDCSACHNFRQDGIGPQLGGITGKVSAEWLIRFIKDPKAVVESGDDRGKMLLARFKTMMPSFAHYSDEELADIIAFLKTQTAPDFPAAQTSAQALADPLPGSIEMSDLVVAVEFVTELPATADKGFKTRITKLDFIPGTDRLFIVDIRGKLYELQGDRPRVYMDMAVLKPEFIDGPGLATGFGSFAFHPEFEKNGLLYTSHAEPPGTAKADFNYPDSIPVTVQWVISEWRTQQPGGFPFKGNSRELLRIDMVTGMHGVQELTFNPTSTPGDEDYGLLYIGVGDGACVEDGYPFLVQNIEKPWGTILRLDVDGNNSRNGQYGIPAGNPFVNRGNKQALGEIYAYGFRNPHRITWTKDGQMLASNIGQAHIESVNLVRAGHNYGWPIREGTFLLDPYGDITRVFPLPEDDARYGITYPVAQYDHDDGLAITGGYEYTGTSIPGLQGKYLFGDMNNGRLYFIDLPDVKPEMIAGIREWKITSNGIPTTTAALCGSERVDLRFGKDQNGDLYFFSKQDGKVWRLSAAGSGKSGL